jgi:hypothetical protein
MEVAVDFVEDVDGERCGVVAVINRSAYTCSGSSGRISRA